MSTDTIHILLVEDEETLSTIIKETLELRGFRFTIAKNGIEGWTSFQKESQTYASWASLTQLASFENSNCFRLPYLPEN